MVDAKQHHGTIVRIDPIIHSMEVAHTIARLAGFAFGHAAWSICDIDEVLCPFTTTLTPVGREMARLAGGEMSAMVADARAELAQLQDIQGYVVAFEGYLPQQGGKADALIIEAGAPGLAPITFAHRYTKEVSRGLMGLGPRKVKAFRLVGNLQVQAQGATTDPEGVNALAAEFYEGMADHPQANELARTWFDD